MGKGKPEREASIPEEWGNNEPNVRGKAKGRRAIQLAAFELEFYIERSENRILLEKAEASWMGKEERITANIEGELRSNIDRDTSRALFV